MSAVPLLVIGSGPAGIHAAKAYVEAGGAGPVVVVSADVDEPYQRPPLSKDVLAGEAPPEVTPLLDDDEDLPDAVEVRLDTAVASLDLAGRVVRTEAGDELAYERLVIATGSHPTALPEADADARVLTPALAGRRPHAGRGRRAGDVGGRGRLGLHRLRGRGQPRRAAASAPPWSPPRPCPRPLASERTPAPASPAGSARPACDLRTGVRVDGVRAPATVTLDDGTVLEADLVLAAVGVSPEQEWLRDAGLVTDDDGRLVVDATLRTTDPHVWAAGDVARAEHAVAGRGLAVEHWGDAMAMGEVAGQNAAGGEERWSDAPGFWSDIGEHTLKHSAWGDGHDEARLVDHGDGAFTVWYADAEGELVGVLTHERDEDYERGGELLARRARLDEALAG